jgi:hypothetical protein
MGFFGDSAVEKRVEIMLLIQNLSATTQDIWMGKSYAYSPKFGQSQKIFPEHNHISYKL